jgi:prepilin-type N-terminal cleavage/methylation domain-containing protein
MRYGFTLIELLVVMAVIATLLTLAVLRYLGIPHPQIKGEPHSAVIGAEIPADILLSSNSATMRTHIAVKWRR